jgi:hypothetical protein
MTVSQAYNEVRPRKPTVKTSCRVRNELTGRMLCMQVGSRSGNWHDFRNGLSQ